MHSDLVELKGCGFKFWLEWFLHLVFVSAGLDRLSGSKKSNKSWHLGLLKRGNSPKKKLSTPKLDSFKDQKVSALKAGLWPFFAGDDDDDDDDDDDYYYYYYYYVFSIR